MQIARPNEASFEWDEVDEVDSLTDRIAGNFDKAQGLKPRLEIIQMVENLLEVLTHDMLPCMHCDHAPVQGFCTGRVVDRGAAQPE